MQQVQLDRSRDLFSDKENNHVLALASTMEGRTQATKTEGVAAVVLEAERCAESRTALLALRGRRIHLTLLFAMYHEHNRLRPNTETNPSGQNLLVNKAAQLRWLFKGTDHTWDIVACDDGCDKDSAEIAQGIATEAGLDDRVTVIKLQDAIDQGLENFKSIKTTKDSRKGGAILYGLYDIHRRTASIAQGHEHFVIYTDADLSCNVAFSGLLLAMFGGTVNTGIASGARFSPGSFLVGIDGPVGHPELLYQNGNVLHMVFRHYLRSKLLPQLEWMHDTNVGFKCFRVEDLAAILPKVQVWGPSFDVELMLRASDYFESKGVPANQIIKTAPIVFTEDFENSAFTSNDENPDASYTSYVATYKDILETNRRLAAEGSNVPEPGELGEFVSTFWVTRDSWIVYKRMILNMEKARGRRLFFGEEFDVMELSQWAATPLLC